MHPLDPLRPVALLAAAALALLAACSDDSPPPGSATSAGGSQPTTTGTGGAGQGGGPGTGGDAPPAWQTVLDAADLDGAVLSVWGSSPDDVYAVGGPLGNSGFETLAVHYDGSAWRRLSPGGAETFWWVSGSAPDDVWMVGENGRIAHWDGSGFTEHDSGVTATLWGVWAASKTDAWAVGGTPGGGAGPQNDIVLRWDGAAWAPAPLPGAPLGRSLYKVWGTASEDLYVVGEKGTVWHRKGTVWTLEQDQALAHGTLFTVSGCSATEVYAVGGPDVLRSDGQAFAEVDVALTNLVNGVACGPSGSVLLVGAGGLKQRLVDGAWIDDFTLMPYDDLHAAWSDGQGAFWAAGGDFFSSPVAGKRRNGVVARYGPGLVATTITP
jgi:hypothetical protein